MMQKMMNQMRAEALRALANRAKTRLGLVTSYDPGAYCVKVTIEPEGTETGWLPLLSPWVGNEWGLFAPPTIGDMVELSFQEGDTEAGIAGARFFSDANRPLPVPSGEFWLVHQSGSMVKFLNDGSIELQAATNLTASAPNGVLRLAGDTVQVHASSVYRFDANGQGQKWDGIGVETWQDDDVAKPHHPHSPPEIS